MGKTKKTPAEIAVAVLKATGNPAVGVGDGGLLHMIAEKLGMPHEGFRTEKKVLDRIDRTNRDDLIKAFTCWPSVGMSRCRQFWLPEEFPKRRLR
jgi:hypothetical protein